MIKHEWVCVPECLTIFANISSDDTCSQLVTSIALRVGGAAYTPELRITRTHAEQMCRLSAITLTAGPFTMPYQAVLATLSIQTRKLCLLLPVRC